MSTSGDGEVETSAIDEDRRQADKAKNALPRRSFVSDMPDRGLFALFAIGGFALIMFTKERELLSPVVVASIAAVLMVAYGVAAFRMPGMQARLDRLGDNFYYLGFIYTLASLSAALLQLTKGFDLDAVLGNFGIALITTIIGVAGRVFFVQMRSELEDVEDHVRRDILSSSMELKGQLLAAIKEFETFHIGLKLAAEEQINNHIANASKVAREQILKIGEIAHSATDVLDSSSSALSSEAKRLVDSAEKLSKATSGFESHVSSLSEPIAVLHSTIEQLHAELRREREIRRARRWRWWPAAWFAAQGQVREARAPRST